MLKKLVSGRVSRSQFIIQALGANLAWAFFATIFEIIYEDLGFSAAEGTLVFLTGFFAFLMLSFVLLLAIRRTRDAGFNPWLTPLFLFLGPLVLVLIFAPSKEAKNGS